MNCSRPRWPGINFESGLCAICIDLDGVICRLKEPGQTYADLEPIAGEIDELRKLKAAGHTIIISTARHMKTCDGNVGQVVARQGLITLDWLARHGIEYDQIRFGKPHAQIYIDDNAWRFESSSVIAGNGSSLPLKTNSAGRPKNRNHDEHRRVHGLPRGSSCPAQSAP